MATSILSTTALDFTSNGSSTNAKVTATADTLTFEGTSSGTCILAGLATPTAADHAATKSYVDNATEGLDWKDAVVCATTANIDLATDLQNGDSIDGVTLVTGERVLVKDQSTGAQNGIYIVVASGSAASSRASDMATGDSAASNAMFIKEGTSNGDTAWVCTNNDGSDVVGTDALVFVQFSGGQSPGGSDTQMQYNNSGTLGGLSTLTTNGTNLSMSGGNITLADSDNLQFGAGQDLDIQHNGTNSLITSSTGDLITDNIAATGSTIFRCGTDTSATDFQVQNDSESAIFLVDASGQADFSGNVDATGGVDIDADSVALTIGAGADLSISHDGTDTTATSATGDFIVDNTNATGSSIMRLGADTTAVDFQVQNNSETAALTVYGTGDVVTSDDLTVQGRIANTTTVTTESTASAVTYTAAEMWGGLIRRDPAGAARADLLDTAANIVGAVQSAEVGSSFEFVVENTADAAETITVTTNTGLTLVGTMTIEQNEARRFKAVMTNVTGASEAVTVYDYGAMGALGGTPGGSDTQIQYNNAGEFGGLSTVTTDGTNFAISGGNLTLADNDNLQIGTGGDLDLSHDGTDSLITSTTGDLTIDNTNATGSTIFLLGTDTSATDFQVQNNSASALLTIDGSGAMDVTGATNFNDTTQSTSSTTGAVIIDGGVGIAKDVFCAGDMNAVAFNA